MYKLALQVFIFSTLFSKDEKKDNKSSQGNVGLPMCHWELQPCNIMQQSASSQGVPASLSDSYFPLAPSRKIETVYEKWKEGGKCHLLSVTPPVSVPVPAPRKRNKDI